MKKQKEKIPFQVAMERLSRMNIDFKVKNVLGNPDSMAQDSYSWCENEMQFEDRLSVSGVSTDYQEFKVVELKYDEELGLMCPQKNNSSTI